MVKGMTRRVIVIKSPDKRLFEEAVFFLRDDAECGVSSDEIIEQARAVADGFVRGRESKSRFIKLFERLYIPLWIIAGGCAASAVWAAVVFLF